jgi:hypothetical protein
MTADPDLAGSAAFSVDFLMVDGLVLQVSTLGPDG